MPCAPVKTGGLPLLYKGGGFAATDAAAAMTAGA